MSLHQRVWEDGFAGQWHSRVRRPACQQVADTFAVGEVSYVLVYGADSVRRPQHILTFSFSPIDAPSCRVPDVIDLRQGSKHDGIEFIDGTE
jgi:hypothetical protein